MNSSRVSIKDIARAAGVSHSTVSRALRDSPLISEATRARIQRLAVEMGYTPDAIARSLQTRRTNTIGLVVTSIADPFFADIVEGVEEVAAGAQMSVFLSASHKDPEREIEVIETFHRRRVDGIIVASSRLGSRYGARLERIRVPVVLVNRHAEGEHVFIHSISVDDEAGARMAVEHLLDLGHRRVGYIGMGNRLLSNRHRHQGYRAAMAAAGITPEPAWVAITPHDASAGERSDVDSGRALFPELWEAGVTALFCYNDRVAVGALLACREVGVAEPRACSIVGFDNIDLASYVTPHLTTVNQPKRQMGRLAMQMVLDLLDGQSVENVILSPTLVERASTAPPSS